MGIDYSDPTVWSASPLTWVLVIAMGISFLTALTAMVWAALRKSRDGKARGSLRWKLNLVAWCGCFVLSLLLAVYPWNGPALSIRVFFGVLAVGSLVILVRVIRWPALKS